MASVDFLSDHFPSMFNYFLNFTGDCSLTQIYRIIFLWELFYNLLEALHEIFDFSAVN